VPTRAACHRLTDEAIIERLIELHGVGQWTVEMLLIFTLGRPDVLPVDDFGVREGFKRAYRRRRQPTPKQLRRYGERWKPYRSVAAWYLWRAAEQALHRKIEPKIG
jgi:DNA-3-methyladenine glycosylase II